MKNKQEKIHTYKGMPVNKKNNGDSNPKILKKLDEIITSTTTKHSRVVIPRLNCCAPDDGKEHDVQDASGKMINSLTTYLKRKGEKKGKNFDPKYITCIEQKSSHNQHTHTALFLNGNDVWNMTDEILDKTDQYWCSALDVKRGKELVNHSGPKEIKKKYLRGKDIVLERNAPDFQERKAEAFEYLSYLAKCETKESGKKYQNSYSYSQKL